jgi:hypothetical protein
MALDKLQWFYKFSSTSLQHGFSQSKNYYSLFTLGSGCSLEVLLVYVDDIIVSVPNLQKVHEVQSLFQLKVLGDWKYFLALEIAKSSKGISLSQRKYTLSLLDDTLFN